MVDSSMLSGMSLSVLSVLALSSRFDGRYDRGRRV